MEMREPFRGLNLLEQVTGAADTTTEPMAVLEATCRELALALDVPRVVATLLNETRTEIAIVAQHPKKGHPATANLALPIKDNPIIQQIVEHKEPQSVVDVQQNPHVATFHCIAQELSITIASLLILPLTVLDQVVGAIALLSTERREFSKMEIASAVKAATAAAQAMRNAQLLAAERQARQQSDTLSEIARELNTTSNLDAALDLVLCQMERVIALDSGAIMLIEGDQMRMVAVRGFEKPEQVLGRRLDLNIALLNRKVVETKRPLLIGSVTQDPRWRKPMEISGLSPELEQIHSWMGVPLLIQDRVIGMLTVDKTEPNFYQSQDAELALAFASHAAVAIENARLLESERAQFRLSRTLQQVGALLTTRMSLDEVLEQLFDLLAQVLAYDSVSIQLIGKKGDMELAAERGLPSRSVASRMVLSIASQSLEERWGEERVIVLPDTAADSRWVTGVGVDYIRSWIGAALVVREQVLGVLNVDSATVNAFDEATGETVAAFANQAAVAIENARLYEQAQHEIAERMRTERETAERHMYLAGVMSSAPDAIVTTDADHKITEWNPGAERVFGYSRQEAIGHDLDKLITNPDTWQEAINLTRGAIDERQVVLPLETVRYRKGGKPVNVIIAGAPIIVDDEVIGTVVSYTDITERVRAEKALRSKATQQEALNAIIAAAGSTLDLQELLDTVLDHILRAAGVKLGQIWALGFQDRGSDQLAPEFLQALSADFTSPIVTSDRNKETNKEKIDGLSPALRELIERNNARAFLAIPILAAGQTIGGFMVADTEPRAWSPEKIALLATVGGQLGTAVERLRLLERIREQVQQVHQIVDTVPDGVLLLGDQSHVILVNPLAREYLALLANAKTGDILTQLGGRPLAELLAPPQDGRWHEISISGPPPRTFEILAQSLAAVAESSRPRESPQESNEGWVMVIRDVTQERKVHQQVQEQARLAAVGQLAAGIAHDFNNIMAVIVLYAQLSLRAPDLSSKTIERLNTILGQARRATDLTQQILDFGRRAILERRPLNLASFLKEQIILLRRTLPENIHLELLQGPREYTINADLTRIQQIIMNLALNARDAMPDGGSLRIKLDQIQVRSDEQPPVREMGIGEWVQISVVDTGTGIPPDVLPRIFEPFFTTKAPLGTGLGLSQVFGIVRQHKGHITVESQLGHGTTFTLYLPAWTETLPDSASQETLDIPKGAGETLLVVEDDPSTREALVDSLEILNYHVLAAKNGREALGILQRHPVVLVLSDLIMPEMGGADLFHAIKRDYPAISIVVLTGHPLNDIKDSLADEIAVWLQKPISLERLAKVVQRTLWDSRSP
jgi:PAS domain S-box-containing protein